MPRKNRIAYKNAWYHVFNRAAGRRTVCFNESHFRLFLSLLGDLQERYGVETHAYCMMKNHYHMFLHTPLGNISEAMWYFGINFSKQINKEINSDGPLFRNRFKSVLVESDSHSLALCRYIHLNPVTANLVTHPEEFEWSSFNSYLHPHRAPQFLKTKHIMSHFMSPFEFSEYTNLGLDQEIKAFYSKMYVSSILGSKAFVEIHK